MAPNAIERGLIAETGDTDTGLKYNNTISMNKMGNIRERVNVP